VERAEEQDLTREFQGLSVRHYSSPSGRSSSNNPFLSHQSTAPTPRYNPFVTAQPADPISSQNPFTNPANPYPQLGPRPTNTPVVGHSAYSPYASIHQATYESSAGYLAPPQANPSYAMQSPDRHSRRRSQTPAINSSQPQQYGASIRRPQSVQSQKSSQSLDYSSVLPARPRSSLSVRGLKVLKQKDYRGFFKPGRV
jgi:hypothetical protein